MASEFDHVLHYLKVDPNDKAKANAADYIIRTHGSYITDSNAFKQSLMNKDRNIISLLEDINYTSNGEEKKTVFWPLLMDIKRVFELI